MSSMTGRAVTRTASRRAAAGVRTRHLEVVREPARAVPVAAAGHRPVLRAGASAPGSRVPAPGRQGASRCRVVAPGAGLVSAGPTGAAPLRLTRRGRAVVRVGAGVLLALLVVLAVLLLGRPALAGTEARPVTLEVVQVQPGETLWDIAGRVAPDVDRRDTVLRIVELNALSSSSVRPGQQLAIPPA